MTKLVLAVFLWCFAFGVVFSYFDDEEEKPVFVTAAVGDWVIFDCDIEFPQRVPIPYVLKWTKEGETIYSSQEGVWQSSMPFVGRIQRTDDPRYGKASINLTSVREEDAGWFKCQTTFPNRTPPYTNNGTWFYLTVSGVNLLYEFPTNQTVMEGEEVTFSCSRREERIKITWFKDKVPLDELPDILQRTWILDDGSLRINRTTMGDLGEYECVAENAFGDRQIIRAYLNIQYKAKVIYAPREVHLAYGRPAILDCHFRANPPLTNLRWEKDGYLFDPYNVQGVFYRRNGSLYFSKVDETHGGLYTCTPYNELGTEGASPNIEVIIQRPPVFVTTPHNMYLRKIGESVEFPCDARDGEEGHKPIIVWYKKDGSSLPVGRYLIKDGNLTILDINEEDRGLYQCSASNEAATITAEAELVLENVPPRAPHNLSALSTTNSVHLTWMGGMNRANTEYSVWYKIIDAPEWKTVKISSKRALETNITNLMPGREYEFMVLSKDDSEGGLFSKAIRVWTKGYNLDSNQFASSRDQELGPPRDLKVHVTNDGFLVVWEPPEFGLQNLRVYIVRWLQGPWEHLAGTSETKNTSYLVTGLEEGQEYHFQVVSMSYNDYQLASSKISITVPSQKKMRAISLGLTSAVFFIAIVILIAYYIRKKWCQPYKKTEKLSPK